MTPEQEKPLAVTATEAAMRRYRISRAVSDLLHSLKRWVVVYPMRQSDILPDHNVAWVTEHDGGPGRVIEAAIKANPALWLHALPAGVCIVPRTRLLSIGLTDGAIDHLHEDGVAMVESEAHRQYLEAKQND